MYNWNWSSICDRLKYIKTRIFTKIDYNLIFFKSLDFTTKENKAWCCNIFLLLYHKHMRQIYVFEIMFN